MISKEDRKMASKIKGIQKCVLLCIFFFSITQTVSRKSELVRHFRCWARLLETVNRCRAPELFFLERRGCGASEFWVLCECFGNLEERFWRDFGILRFFSPKLTDFAVTSQLANVPDSVEISDDSVVLEPGQIFALGQHGQQQIVQGLFVVAELQHKVRCWGKSFNVRGHCFCRNFEPSVLW